LTPIDLQNIFWKSERLPSDVSSIQGFIQSIGGKPVLEKTQNGKISGEKGTDLKRVDVRFSFGGAFASVRENTVTISGSVEWKTTYNVLVKIVPDIKSLEFTVTNTAIKFYLKKEVALTRIERERRKGPNYKIEYEPELYAGMRIKFSDGVLATIFANGTVTAQGRNLTGVEKRVRDLLDTYTNPYKTNKPVTPIAARKNLAAKRTRAIENRYEPARNWTNTRAGYYVRPGPNKSARFYKIPANPALVRTKVVRAYANIGVNIPYTTRRALGIVNAAPPHLKNKKKTATMAKNWNASPPTGMYIRPGPGGLPKFYKVPRLIKQGKKTVIDAYAKAGIKVPSKVKTLFGISPSPPPTMPTRSVPKLKGNINERGKFRIDGLDCTRYTLDSLKKIASKLDIPITRRRKDQLCNDIRKKLVSTSSASPARMVNENFIKNGVKHWVLSNERKIKRNSKTKAMNSFKIEELKNFIKMVNSTANVSGKKTKKELVNMLIERKRTSNLAKAMFENFSPSNSNSSPSPSPAGRTGINIARNILGPNFTNSELQNFLNRYTKSPNSLNKLVSEFKTRRRVATREVL
jgi:hypothetical protein